MIINNKPKTAICFIFDSKYNQGKYAILSAKKNNPNHTIVLLTDTPIKIHDSIDIQLTPSDVNLQNNHNWLTVGRVTLVRFALYKLGFDTAIFIDGDTYSYYNYDELQKEIEQHSILVIPHITRPLPNDDLYPQNRVIALSGNYNSGVWAASKKGLEFINWWEEQTALFPVVKPELGLVNEQGWLRFAGDFCDNIKIFRHPGYNVAYWNIKQRELIKINNEYLIDGKPLTIVHFSGFKKDVDPSQMSVFQNRYILDRSDIAYEIYNDYHNLVWR